MNYLLIVIYNKKCSDSLSVKSIIKENAQKDYQVIIFDNSTTEFQNDRFCKNYEFKYYGNQNNYGLSKAYNYVIERIHQRNGYIVILDDDTQVDRSYFEEAKKYQSLNKFDVILPIVKAGTLILSPSNIKFGCGVKVVKSIEQIDFNKVTAINSGMIVKLSVYDSLNYDERLFLDCVDHDFMHSVREKNLQIKIMESSIKQNYSRNEKSNIQNAITRFKIYKKDFKVYATKRENLLFYRLSLFKLAVHNSIKYRAIIFMKLLFEK